MQEAEPGAVWQPRGMGWEWEGGSREREHMHAYDWFMVMCGRNQHNSVEQLYSS